MGGNLFGLGRLPRAEYLNIEAELRTYLDALLGDGYRIPRYYETKPYFGDLDIVISSRSLKTTCAALRQQILDELQITHSKSNPSVFSTVFRNFQVDYFLKEEQDFLSTYNFLCYNDLGNILGRIFHRMKFKYGEQGLQYVYRRPAGNYRKEYDIFRVIERIPPFIEPHPARSHAGFPTTKAMAA